MDHETIADVLREHSGIWVPILQDEDVARAHARVNNWKPGPRSKRPKAYGPRFEFRVKSRGYGTYRADILARHTAVTIPINL